MKAMARTFAALEPHRELLWRAHPTIPLSFGVSPFRTNTFHNIEHQRYFVAVVNDDTHEQAASTVFFLPSVKSVRDLIRKQTLPLQVDERRGLPCVHLSLPAGEGTLLEVEWNVSDPAAQIYFEDFSIQTTCAQFHNATRRMIPIGWGLGYRMVGCPEAPKGQHPQPQQPAWIQYEIDKVVGDIVNMRGRLYAVSEGFGRKGVENIKLSFSTDGTHFSRISVDEYGVPIPILKTTTHLRFTLLTESVILVKWRIINVL